MESIKKIHELLEPYLENGKFFVVDLNISSSKKNPTLVLLIDSDAGITIDECAYISRKLGNDVEAENVFETPFVLEVSSPGVDISLTNARQYSKNIGRVLKITLLEGDKKQGKLSAVTDTGIEIFEEVLKGKLKTIKKEPLFLEFAKIKMAQVQVSFG
ncbi:MAG: ribosome maturation factor RimP [Bacteroidota bacterium]